MSSGYDGRCRVFLVQPQRSAGSIRRGRHGPRLKEPEVVKTMTIEQARRIAFGWKRNHKNHRISICDLVGNVLEEYNS